MIADLERDRDLLLRALSVLTTHPGGLSAERARVLAAQESLVRSAGRFIDWLGVAEYSIAGPFVRGVLELSAALIADAAAGPRVGDPDPTPDLPAVDEYCQARGPFEGRSCTLPVEHEGAHVAGNGRIVLDVWGAA